MPMPTWKLLYSTDYSALYIDETGVSELHIAQDYDDVDEEDVEAIAAMVYRFPLVSLDSSRTDLPHPTESYLPWFADSLGDIASSCGRSVADLVADLCSGDPRALASAYERI